MVNIEKKIVSLLLVIFIMGCGYLNGETRSKLIDKKKTREISIAEAERLGYNTSLMNISIDENNTLWRKYSSSLNLTTGATLLDEMPEVKNKLRNKIFWAVYFDPRNIEQHGGDLWVFVDRTTGDVILYLKGY